MKSRIAIAMARFLFMTLRLADEKRLSLFIRTVKSGRNAF